MMTIKIALLAILMLCLGAASAARAQDSAPPAPVQRCVNMGNMLESPNEGEWGFRAQESFFTTIAEAGFDSIRLPVSWSTHADTAAPYTIDPAFFDRIDTVIGWALDANLTVILNIHHFNEMMSAPEDSLPRLLALWDQIASHYADMPATLLFEALNEPNDQLTPALWNQLQPQVVAAIRASNPTRTIIVGGGQWNSLDGLQELELPEDDHLMATFHFYSPFEFTHQGAEWSPGMDAHLGTTWGSDAEYEWLTSTLEHAAQWSEKNGVPVLLGEFGAYSRADMESRLRWTQAVRETVESVGIGWCYWEFAAGFGIYDRAQGKFNELYGSLQRGSSVGGD